MLKSSFVIITLSVLIFISCSKKVSGDETKHSPIANAGPDQEISFPNDSVTLNGSASSDPDNNIKSYRWKQISGPVSFWSQYPTTTNVLNDSTSPLRKVFGLRNGSYWFELKVTNTLGLSSKDTMMIVMKSDNTKNIVFYDKSWESGCKISIPSIYSYIPQNTSLRVYSRWHSNGLSISQWELIDISPSSFIHYQIINGDLAIILKGDCAFDSGDSRDYWIAWN